jgi:large subunit ribosomal protein L15
MKEKKSKNEQVIKKPAARRAVVKKQVLENSEEKPALNSVALHNLKRPFGSHKKRKLLGRGSGSGHGKTSTRGSKGQTSRAGRHFYLGFEGGQSPLIRKMPKRGFVSNFKKTYQIVNLGDLNNIKEAMVTPQLLRDNGLIRDERALIKVLGNGGIKNPVTVQAHAFSKRASAEIIAAGGKAEIINI